MAPVKRPRLRHSSVGAAPASERAQLPAERSEERRLPLAVQRVCGVKGVWGHHCDSSIVWGGAGRSPSGVPASGLTRNRPDSVIGQQLPGLVFFAGRQRDREPRKRLAQQPVLPKMALLRAFPVRLAVPQVRRDSRTTAPSRTPSPRRSLRPADRTNAAIAHLRRPPNANAALCAPQVAVRANAAARMFSTDLEAKTDPALTKELNDNMGNAPPRTRRGPIAR